MTYRGDRLQPGRGTSPPRRLVDAVFAGVALFGYRAIPVAIVGIPLCLLAGDMDAAVYLAVLLVSFLLAGAMGGLVYHSIAGSRPYRLLLGWVLAAEAAVAVVVASLLIFEATVYAGQESDSILYAMVTEPGVLTFLAVSAALLGWVGARVIGDFSLRGAGSPPAWRRRSRRLP
jgi:hypothetical protein